MHSKNKVDHSYQSSDTLARKYAPTRYKGDYKANQPFIPDPEYHTLHDNGTWRWSKNVYCSITDRCLTGQLIRGAPSNNQTGYGKQGAETINRCKAYTDDGVDILQEMLFDPKQGGQVRLNCWIALRDHGYGKVTNRHVHSAETQPTMTPAPIIVSQETYDEGEGTYDELVKQGYSSSLREERRKIEEGDYE